MDNQFNKSINLKFLDGLRGIAALVVMIGHARWLLWEGFSEGFIMHPEQYSAIEKLSVYFFSIFRYGHEAVLFFFVLSGFVIHLKYSRDLSSSKNVLFDTRDYFIRRAKRIYPPFLFILFLTFVLDKIGMSMGYTIYFHQTPNELLNNNVPTNHTLINLIGNLFFLQTDHVSIWGSNSPLWSLKYEWWFYCLYPLLFIVNRRSVVAGLILVTLLFVLSITLTGLHAPFYLTVFTYLFSWWMGVLIADIYTKRMNISFGILSPLTLCIPLMLFFSNKITNLIIADTIWAIGFMGLLSIFFYMYDKGKRFILIEKFKWLGDCSYTLYILHFPILVFLNGVILSKTGNKMPVSQLYLIAAVIGITALCYFIYPFLEKPKFLTKYLPPKPTVNVKSAPGV